MPPPPPPPPGPPPPVVAAKAAPPPTAGGFLGEMTGKTDEVEAIIPARPKTPPDLGPEKFYDVSTAWLSAHDLFNRLQFGSQLLLVDCRSQAAFDKTHIRSAVSVDWAAVKADDMLEVEKRCNARFAQRRMFTVILYDDQSTEEAVGETMQGLVDALVAERRASQTVLLLRGGLDLMTAEHGYMVKGTPAFSDSEFPSEILEGFLYLGSYATASNREALLALGITHIVNATDACDMPFRDDFKYVQCPLDDKPEADIAQYFQSSLAFMREAKAHDGRVLVHCKMGMSRSPTIVMVWLMHELSLSLKQSNDMCREKRPYINPNPGFLRQLSGLEEKLRGKTTIRFPTDGKPITVRTIYEWLNDDGTWTPRVTVTQAS